MGNRTFIIYHDAMVFYYKIPLNYHTAMEKPLFFTLYKKGLFIF